MFFTLSIILTAFPLFVNITPTSPVCSHPSLSTVFAVFSLSLRYPLNNTGPLIHISPLGSGSPVSGFLSFDVYSNSGTSTSLTSFANPGPPT